MAPLAFLAGEWQGEGWMMFGPNERHTFVQHESVESKEARPLATGAADGRRNLFRWVVDSPDVSVSLCQGVVGPLVDSNNANTADLLNLFILSSAAHQIETPGADKVATNVAGLKGALAAYTVMLSQQGRRARNSFLEKTRERRDGGTLVAFVRSSVSGC